MVVALLQYFRRFPFNWTTKLYNKLFLRLSLDDQQACYRKSLVLQFDTFSHHDTPVEWMLVWLSTQPMWGEIVSFSFNGLLNFTSSQVGMSGLR